MSRWKSPQIAVKRAKHAAKAKATRRREMRRSWTLVIGIALVSAGLMVADYFWLRYQARQHHERQQQHGGPTNSPDSNASGAEQNHGTNHE